MAVSVLRFSTLFVLPCSVSAPHGFLLPDHSDFAIGHTQTCIHTSTRSAIMVPLGVCICVRICAMPVCDACVTEVSNACCNSSRQRVYVGKVQVQKKHPLQPNLAADAAYRTSEDWQKGSRPAPTRPSCVPVFVFRQCFSVCLCV